jgi:hypothetical protein
MTPARPTNRFGETATVGLRSPTGQAGALTARRRTSSVVGSATVAMAITIHSGEAAPSVVETR